MPLHTIHLDCNIRRSFHVEQIAGLFDLPIQNRLAHTLTAELPGLDEPWTIGAIVGPSGSGKTTLARVVYGPSLYSARAWPADRAIIDCLGDAGIKTLARLLAAVGLSSPPAWLKPHHVLSTGERFRADLARAIVERDERQGLIVFDEFTSTLDRTVAKTTSAALGKFLRQNSLATPIRFVALSCHTDFLPWLAPDWTLDLSNGARLTRGCLRRPELQLRVGRVPQSLWPCFAPHHYLSGGLSRAASCYAAFHEASPIAFCAVVASLGWKQTKRITRLVTLPEYQGLGIGMRLAEAVCRTECERGNRITITASHPSIVGYCWHSPKWRYLGLKKIGSTRQCYAQRTIRSSAGRAVASFQFIDTEMDPHEHR